MRRSTRRLALAPAFAVLAALTLAPIAAHAVNPDEMLQDPAQEARARQLSAELRCLQCQNQSIDDSDAPFSREIRLLLREKIAVGKSDTEILDFLVARYGQYVLLKPQFNAVTAVLWLGPFALVGCGAVYLWQRRSRRRDDLFILTEDEEARLEKLLQEVDETSRPGRPASPSVTRR